MDIAEEENQPGERPCVARGVRVAAQIHLVAEEDVFHVARMQRIDERMLRLGEVDVVVALNRLIEERKADEQHQPQAQQQGLARYAGFHRNTGLRAAVTSSTRLVRV